MKKSLLLKIVSAIVILVAVISPLAVTTPAMAADLISCDENGKCTVSLLYYGKNYAVNYEHAFKLLGKGEDSWTFPGGNIPVSLGERLGDINNDTVFLTLDNGHNQTIKAAGLCDVSAILHWYIETHLGFSVDNPGNHSQVPVLPEDERYWDVIEENASGVYIADTIFHNPGSEVTIYWTIENHTLTIWNSRNGGSLSFQTPVINTITEPVWEGDYIHEQCPIMDTSQSGETTYPLGIVVHHTASSGSWFDAAVGSAHCGESRPPYLLVIDTDGVIHQTAKFGSVTYHACCDGSGNNADYASIALVGNYTNEEPSRVMQDALVEAIMWLESKGVNPVVKGHREVARTECPGDALQALLPELAIEAQRGQTVITVAGTTSSWLPAAVSADIWWWAGGVALVLLIFYWLGDYARVKRATRQGRVLPSQKYFDRLIRWYLATLTLLVAVWLATGSQISLLPTRILEVGLGVGVVVLFTTRTPERRVTLGWSFLVLGSLVAVLHCGPRGDLIILMTADVVVVVVAFFIVERWLVKQRVHWKGDRSDPIIPYDIREGIYGFGVMMVLAYLVGVMITLVRMPPPGYAAEWGWFSGGTTPHYLEPVPPEWTIPLQDIPTRFETTVAEYADEVVVIAREVGVPPEVPFVLWMKEHSGTQTNPGNGEGICGFHDLVVSGQETFPPGPIDHKETLRQLRLCAQEFKRRSGDLIIFETTDLSVLGPVYMRYNGNLSCYGGKFKDWTYHPYVMNGWDDAHLNMVARTGDPDMPCIALKVIGAIPAHVRIGVYLRSLAEKVPTPTPTPKPNPDAPTCIDPNAFCGFALPGKPNDYILGAISIDGLGFHCNLANECGWDWWKPGHLSSSEDPTDVLSMLNGEVTKIGVYKNKTPYIEVTNQSGRRQWAYHCDKYYVAVGDPVVWGQPICLMGDKGDSDWTHLHLVLQDVDGSSIFDQTQWVP